MIDTKLKDHKMAQVDDMIAGLPHAPLAMPKQVLEAGRSGFLTGLLSRFAGQNARSEG